MKRRRVRPRPAKKSVWRGWISRIHKPVRAWSAEQYGWLFMGIIALALLVIAMMVFLHPLPDHFAGGIILVLAAAAITVFGLAVEKEGELKVAYGLLFFSIRCVIRREKHPRWFRVHQIVNYGVAVALLVLAVLVVLKVGG